MSIFWTDEHVLSVTDILETIEGLKRLPSPGTGAPDSDMHYQQLWGEIKEMRLRISKLEERLDRIEKDFAGGADTEDGGLTEYGRNLGVEEKKP